MRVRAEIINVTLRHPFQLARGPADTTRETVIVHLGDALGEATPIRYAGETAAAVRDALDGLKVADDVTLDTLGDVLDAFAAQHPQLRSAWAGLDFALHDLVGRRMGRPIYQMLDLDPVLAPATSFTLAMAAPDLLRRKVEEAAPYAIFKVKLGSPADWDTLALIRSRTDKPIRVDANEGWTVEQALAMTQRLPEFGVELVEQPVQRDDLDGLAAVTAASPLPVIADESCQHYADLDQLAGRVHGINIKLMKCGGLRQGLRMVRRASELGLRVMLGCMIETSIGITAAAHLSPLVDWADLDGHLLISDDPFVGVTLDPTGRLVLPAEAGLGVKVRA